jgi:hypothetical protein
MFKYKIEKSRCLSAFESEMTKISMQQSLAIFNDCIEWFNVFLFL